MIPAILAGIALNLLGAADFLAEQPVTGGILATLDFLSALTILLILIIVGYGIRLDREGPRRGAGDGVRLAILIPLALLVNAVIVRGLLTWSARSRSRCSRCSSCRRRLSFRSTCGKTARREALRQQRADAVHGRLAGDLLDYFVLNPQL